ncbi:MAG: flagellar basal body-associated protein FliL [Paracoccaceae bacterium]
MANAGEATEKSKSKLLLIALPVALIAGGAAFYGAYSGLLPLPGAGAPEMADGVADESPMPTELEPARNDHMVPTAFVSLDPLIISLGPTANADHLKITLTIEVAPEDAEAVEAVRPRILDVLNTFLRAVDEAVLENPQSMFRLRAQILRRVEFASPPNTVRDILIQEFVLH